MGHLQRPSECGRVGPISNLCQGELLTLLLGATRAARNPNLQVVVMCASHVCSQHSFGLPLGMSEIHITQIDHSNVDVLYHSASDHGCLDHLSCETCVKHSIGVKAFSFSIVAARTP